jgi:hypothetical protein
LDLVLGGEKQQVNSAGRGGRGGQRGSNSGGADRGCGRSNFRYRGTGSSGGTRQGNQGDYNKRNTNNSSGERPLCHVCFKKGHVASV